MRRNLLVAAWVALALATMHREAGAQTLFPSPYSRIARLTVNGTVQYHIIAPDGFVYSKPAAGSWERVNPSGGPSGGLYGWLFGPAGVQTSGTY